MSRRAVTFAGMFFLVMLVGLGSTSGVRAESQGQPAQADSPLDLIDAVNALRASYGLAPYTISPILMYTAQAQADFMATTGSMTHSGSNGIGVTDRLLAAGYPLAGDLSLGGFRSENITGGNENMSAQTAVDRWTGDAPHLTTMISPNLTEIGAGAAVNNGRVYYVIDCALPITAVASQAAVTSVEGGTIVPSAPEDSVVILSVTLSTPNGEGNVVHEVKPGQTLWQIAIAYGARIDEIKSLNNLIDNNIYPGDQLLIGREAARSTNVPVQTATQAAISTSTTLATFVAYTSVPTVVPAVPSSSASSNPVTVKTAISLIVLAFLGGGLVAWLVDLKKEQTHKDSRGRRRKLVE